MTASKTPDGQDHARHSSIISTAEPTITVIPNVFEPRRLTQSLEPGRTIAESLPEPVQPDGSWIVIENGRLLSHQEWQTRLVTRDTELICYPFVENSPGVRIGVGVGLIALALASGGAFAPALGSFGPAWLPMMAGTMGAGLVLGGVQALMMSPPGRAVTPSLTSDAGGSPTYGFGGITNSTRIGAPIPLVYGHQSAFPPLEAFEQPSAGTDVEDVDVRNEPVIDDDEYQLVAA